MFPKIVLPILHSIRKKKIFLIYKAADSNHQYILKCSENTTPALKQALLDEYEDYPSVPSISPKVLWVLREFLITRIKYSCLCALYGVL